jgi:hypothetical protein
MMRKLVVLILVLGMASAANAVLIQVDGKAGAALEVDEGIVPVITVVSEDASSWLGYLIVEDGSAGVLSDLQKLDAAGDMGSATAYEEAGWGAGYELTVAMSPGGVPPIAVGPQFSASLTGVALDQTSVISLFVDPEYGTPAATTSVKVVPEPMTIMLLGLGGLFLRRRK